MEIIDAYTHCGLHKYKPIAEVRRVMCAAGVQRAVLVQHLGEFDNFQSYRQVFRLAEYPGVHFQVSGMKMFCPYPHEPLHGLVAEAVKQLGSSRLCWGSNYPVVGGEQDYRQDLRLLLDGQLPVPAEAICAIVGANAHRFWFPKS